jgi:Zn-dependent M28 family amino/carboxypeptidase
MIELKYKILIIITIILCACTNEPKQNPKTNKHEQNPKVKVDIPAFNSDSAYYFIEKQVSFGPRVISSNGWKNCGDWLEKKLINYADTVIIQQASITTYDGKNHTLKNIIASFSPKIKKDRIALFAHWDTRHIADQSDPIIYLPIDGANDGGSGVGVLLEMARQFSLKNPKIGVDIILFDAEDYGDHNVDDLTSWCLGSQYWSKNPHKKNYSAKYGILLDMVAAKNAKFYLEGNSVKFASPVVQKVWKKGHKLGYEKYFIFQKTDGIMDDHVPINNSSLGIPTIDIVEFSPSGNFNKHWHTHQDNMNNIDKETIKAVGQTLLEVVYNE